MGYWVVMGGFMRIGKIIIITLLFIQSAFAEVIPLNPKAGDRYIKVTKVEKGEIL